MKDGISSLHFDPCECVNLCAFVDVLSINQALKVSALSAVTYHFSADIEKRLCSERRGENKDFQDTMHTRLISSAPAGCRLLV